MPKPITRPDRDGRCSDCKRIRRRFALYNKSGRDVPGRGRGIVRGLICGDCIENGSRAGRIPPGLQQQVIDDPEVLA